MVAAIGHPEVGGTAQVERSRFDQARRVGERTEHPGDLALDVGVPETRHRCQVVVAFPNLVELVEPERTTPLHELLQFRRGRADHHGLHVYELTAHYAGTLRGLVVVRAHRAPAGPDGGAATHLPGSGDVFCCLSTRLLPRWQFGMSF